MATFKDQPLAVPGKVGIAARRNQLPDRSAQGWHRPDPLAGAAEDDLVVLRRPVRLHCGNVAAGNLDRLTLCQILYPYLRRAVRLVEERDHASVGRETRRAMRAGKRRDEFLAGQFRGQGTS